MEDLLLEIASAAYSCRDIAKRLAVADPAAPANIVALTTLVSQIGATADAGLAACGSHGVCRDANEWHLSPAALNALQALRRGAAQ